MDEKTINRLTECFRKNKDWDFRRRAKALKLPVSLVREFASENGFLDYEPQGCDKPKPKTRPKPKKTLGISMEEFMEERDSVAKVRKQLREAVGLIEANKGRFIKNGELRKEVGCGDPGLWRELALDKDEGFSKYQFIWQEEHWWSDSESVAEIIRTKKKARPVGKTGGSR